MRFLADESCDFAVVTALLIRFPADARSALGQTIVDVRLGEGQVVSGLRIPYRKNGTIGLRIVVDFELRALRAGFGFC